MHGNPREHIWTFAAGRGENYPVRNSGLCPCDINFSAWVPSFVGEDYFCEAGVTFGTSPYFVDTSLWDGKNCHSSSTCCSRRNPPYFTKILNSTTADDLEVRLCQFRQYVYEKIAVELIELYVK